MRAIEINNDQYLKKNVIFRRAKNIRKFNQFGFHGANITISVRKNKNGINWEERTKDIKGNYEYK